MSRTYTDIAFTPAVRAVQTRRGSRAQYEFFDRMSDRGDRLGEREIAFIEACDGFYQASVGQTGWPYVQFRGGPAGFLRVLDDRTLGYADFRGNVQYISVGNLEHDDRVALILMDYANQRRLKVMGRVRFKEAGDDAALIERLRVPGYRATVERAVQIDIEGYDWNCPQHITPRYTEAEVARATAPLRRQLEQAQDRLARRASIAPTTADAPPEAIGNGPLPLVVCGMRQITPRVRAYELRSATGHALPAVEAGSHIALPVRLEDGAETVRPYSIVRATGNPDRYEVAVLRSATGRGSRALHGHYHLGLILNAGLPQNGFALPADARPAVLIAGGIGITPLRAMASALDRRGQSFELHHAVRSAAEAPYAADMRSEFGARLRLACSDVGQRLDVANLLATAAADAVFYVCGPPSLIDAVVSAAEAAGIARDRVRCERFTAPVALAATARPVVLHLQRSGRRIDVAADQSLLDAVELAGIEMPSSCRTGACGTCAVKVLAGTPEHRDQALSAAERSRAALMCLCVSRASTPELTLDL